ncbi:MAG: nitroreductase family protein, partial [Solirubrobacteraceae bacterium]|nr:nitroreductase family protein [Solirubrobacteraceae bacterium]
MDLDSAIRARRTTKNFTDEPVDPAVVRELVELAQWAPNHNTTFPWRFRLIGPEATKALVDIAPADKKGKVVRGKTRVLVSVVVAGDQVRREEDLLATAAAVQNFLLGATARGIDSFWQSPTIAGLAPSRFKLGIPANEQLVAVIHLGQADG